jgi:catechol 2,3-dioxygenase-like lactoylglutathione lyase family enzyme
MKKILSLLFVAIAFGNLHAQDSSFNFSINHLAISVKDVNRSAEFYKNVLRLSEITNRSKIEGIRWFSFGDGRELHLISVIKEEVKINKALHLGLSTNRFDDLLRNIIALKIPFSDWPGTPNKVNIRADGIKQIFFQDPDGYWIEVNNVQ